MASILFAWELGSDYGHLARQLPIARELAARGHRPVFAVRDLLGAERIIVPHGFDVFQAPLWLGKLTNLPPAISYPEMLMRFGFLDPVALTGILRAWRNLMAGIRPDLVVFDHAPTGLLATRGMDVARLNVGDGFCIPPATRPLPPLRWWQRENMARLADSEAHVLAAANQALLALGAPPMSHLGELSESCESLFLSFPELDHYRGREGGEFVGPVFLLGQGKPVVWPAVDGPRVFAYLKPGHAGLENILHALKSLPASVVVHVPGVARKLVADFSRENMVLSPDLLDMEMLRHDCDLCLYHGGVGTTAAMLLAGKPLVLFPMHMEQEMTARRLAELGVAVKAMAEDKGGLARILKQTLANPALGEAARRFASAHEGYDQAATVQLAADRCERLLGV